MPSVQFRRSRRREAGFLDPLDVTARLDELRAMPDGWLDGHGKALSHAGLDWLAASFQRYFPDDLPLPHVYPTPDGGVEAEWSLGAHSVILEISLDTHQGDWLRFAKEDDDDEDSRTLNLDDASSWQQFSGEIRRLTKEDSRLRSEADNGTRRLNSEIG